MNVQHLADWIGEHLVVIDHDGTLQPPGAGPALRLYEPEGGEVAIVARGDSFDVYFSSKTAIYNHAVSPRSAMQLAWWLVWWWIWYAWCGLKPRLWNWVLASGLRKSK